MPQIVITAVGTDRPGLVGEFTGHLLAQGANIADSRMINLKGQFALLILAEGSEDVVRKIQEVAPTAGQTIGLSVTVAGQTGTARVVRGVPYRLKTYSMDQPGIVHRVSEVLRLAEVNIEELATKLESAPMAGTPLFTMDMRLTVPPGINIRKLRADLEALCNTLNCDLDLEPASS